MDAVGYLLRSLGAREWKRLLSLVSPAFFRVVPFTDLAGAVKRGIAQSRDAAAVAKARSQLPQSLPGAESGDAALVAYFAQVLRGDEALLDLSRQAFSPAEGHGGPDAPRAWRWEPAALRYVFEPAFGAALARVYRGFYDDRPEDFSAGLADLGLAGCEDVFRAHFGTGDQTSVTFEVSRFVESFHGIFLECKHRGLRLGGDFVALGVALALLYEHLDSVGGAGRGWNVREAFARARGLAGVNS